MSSDLDYLTFPIDCDTGGKANDQNDSDDDNDQETYQSAESEP
jgi:hypothetical protein